MSNAFDEYNKAMTQAESAEREASTLVGQIRNTLEPLFRDWKTCYFQGVGDVPTNLVRRSGGASPRNPINIANFPTHWSRLQTLMAQYVDALEEAKSAHARLTPDERKRLAPPPWEPRS